MVPVSKLVSRQTRKSSDIISYLFILVNILLALLY